MSFATFSGPIRSGTVREGSGANTGLVVLAKSVALPAAPGATRLGTLPAGSQILNFIVDVTTQFNPATLLTVGTSDSAAAYLASTTITASGDNKRILQSVIDASLVAGALTNVGTSDVTLIATTSTAVATDDPQGAATLTVLYVQRADDGTQVPASA